MLLMKDRSFLYELRAYLIYVKVGEIQKVLGVPVLEHFKLRMHIRIIII